MANSMAKSGSWPGCFSCSVPGRALRRRQWSAPGAGLDGQEWRLGPGVSAAVFLGEIYGAGNGQHLVSASMAKSGSWPGCFSCSVPGRALRRRQWSAPGAGLDGQEWRLGPGCFSCSVPGGDLRRRQRSAPGAGLDGQEWQLGPGYFCCSQELSLDR